MSDNVCYDDLLSSFGAWVDARHSAKPVAAGIDGMSLEAFRQELPRNLREIERLLNQADASSGRLTRYSFSPLLLIQHGKPGSSSREISRATVRDQFVLHLIKEDIKKQFQVKNWQRPASRPADYLRDVIRRGRCQHRLKVFRTDISSFYDSIPHDVMLERIAEIGLAPWQEDLLTQLLSVPVRRADSRREAGADRTRGIPQGISVSPFLAQLYLLPLDDLMEQQGEMLYLRYADDILVAAADDATLDDAQAMIQNWIACHGLSLSQAKTKRTDFACGFTYLGMAFRGDQATVPPQKVEAWLSKLLGIWHRKYVCGMHPGDGHSSGPDVFTDAVNALNRELAGAMGKHLHHYHVADNVDAYRDVDDQLRRRLARFYRLHGVDPHGPHRLASALGWAYKYKKNQHAAEAKAIQMY